MNILSQLREGRSAEDLCKEFAEKMNKAIADYKAEEEAKAEAARKAAEEQARAEVLEEQKTALLEELAHVAYEYAQLAYPNLAEAWAETPIDDFTATLRRTFATASAVNDTLANFSGLEDFFEENPFKNLEW